MSRRSREELAAQDLFRCWLWERSLHSVPEQFWPAWHEVRHAFGDQESGLVELLTPAWQAWLMDEIRKLELRGEV